MARGKTARPASEAVMTDAEVAAYFGISTVTLARRIASPKAGEADFNRATFARVGRRRIWLRESVENLIKGCAGA